MDLGLTPAEARLLKRLNTPRKIQAFLHDLKQNFELDGECCRPVREVLRKGLAVLNVPPRNADEQRKALADILQCPRGAHAPPRRDEAPRQTDRPKRSPVR